MEKQILSAHPICDPYWSTELTYDMGEEIQVVAKTRTPIGAEIIVHRVNHYNDLIEALKYCAEHGRPSIVADVAKEALEKAKMPCTYDYEPIPE
jgi:hypothetical protein